MTRPYERHDCCCGDPACTDFEDRMTASGIPLDQITVPLPPAARPTIRILVNSGLKMSRGKYAAQAVHAALLAVGAHPGGPVIVLGATAEQIADCPVQVHDAGITELAPGTLTAGATPPTKAAQPNV